MTFPCSTGIRLRLHAFFSSRVDIVEACQSTGASLAIAAEASGATFFIASVIALGTMVLEATPAAVAEPFFFTILEYV
jgi:hypothetical protein